MNNESLFIAARKGRIYHYDVAKDRLSLAFEEGDEREIMMGLEKRAGFIYAGGKSKIFRLRIDGKALVVDKKFIAPARPTGFHQMFIFNDCLYITVTIQNEIWKFDLNLNLLKEHRINPPDKNSPCHFRGNYNHINSIFWYNDAFYICLNWFTQEFYRSSGIAILDTGMKEIMRFKYGWEAHNCIVLDGKLYALCATTVDPLTKVKHPHKSGLMVDWELVFEYPSELFFCKDFSISDNFIYIVGGATAQRSDRDFSNGVLFILDREFRHISTHTFNKSGELLGCLLPEKDLTKGGC